MATILKLTHWECTILVAKAYRSQPLSSNRCSVALRHSHRACLAAGITSLSSRIHNQWQPLGVSGTTSGGSVEAAQPEADLRKRARGVSAHATASDVVPDDDGWIRYRGNPAEDQPLWLLPVIISLASLIGYAIRKPYFFETVLPALNRPILGVPVLDAVLIANTRFFADVLAGPDYAKIVLAYVSSVVLSWHLAVGIESSRSDSHKSWLLQSPSVVAFLGTAVGPALVAPLLWVAPYLALNKEGPRKLTPAFVRTKYISADRVSAIFTFVVGSFLPYVGFFLTTGKSFVTCHLLALLLPATWQILWLSSNLVAPAIEGHERARNAHVTVAIASLALHAVVIVMILKDRTLLRRLAALFRKSTPLHLIPVKALVTDLAVLVAGFLTIPLVQEGPKMMMQLVLMMVLIGPGAAISAYFARQEAMYLDVAEDSAQAVTASLGTLRVDGAPS